MTAKLPLDLFAETPVTAECDILSVSGTTAGRWCASHGQLFPCQWAVIQWLTRLSPVLQSVLRKHATWRHLQGCEAEFADRDDTLDADTAAWVSACAELRDVDDSAMEALAKALVAVGLLDAADAAPLPPEAPYV
jgi:hypothetical protein